MDKNTETAFFLEQMPYLYVWYKVLIVYLSQLSIFLLLMVCFWGVSSIFWMYALVLQVIISFCGVFPYRYIATHSDKIRRIYLEKYGGLAGQQLWFHYEFYTISLLSSSLYFPLLLKTDYFLPAFISLPSNVFTMTLFPGYLALSAGVGIIIMGFLIGQPSGGFGPSVESYLYLLYPEKGRLITDGLYKFIRNPRYLSRGCIAIGLGVVANNLLAIGVGFIHFFAFCLLIPSENHELLRRFGNDYKDYKKKTPALLPKYGYWGEFLKFLFFGKKDHFR
jgi:protein-S-isoprenylcysteine O-methyltransferase Ste14